MGFYLLIFQLHRPTSGRRPTRAGAWDKYQFFVFLATALLVNNIVQMFFMPNAEEFSELIRTGNLDFALLEADRHAVFDFAAEGRIGRRWRTWRWECCCWRYAVPRLDGFTPSLLGVRALSAVHRAGRADYVQRMIALAATSVWLGRNQSLYDFWFYITNFARYPMEIYQRPDRRLAPLDAHVRAAGAGGGERAGPAAGQAVPAQYA